LYRYFTLYNILLQEEEIKMKNVTEFYTIKEGEVSLEKLLNLKHEDKMQFNVIPKRFIEEVL